MLFRAKGGNPLPLVRWFLRWELRRLRDLILRLRRRESTLSFHVEQGGPHARQAEALIAALQCVLSDQLVPAADSLERALFSRDLLPEEGAGGDEAGAAA